MFHRRYSGWLLLFMWIPMGLFSCGSHTHHVVTTTEQSIMDFYGIWKGVPYKLGGTDKTGIDCSALTRQCYRDVFHLELPRRVVEQRVEGINVPIDSLQPGDLIVFKGSLFGRPHIGIHISDLNFMHASSSRGVMISSLKDRYWKRKFKMARRMIDAHGKLILDKEK